MWESEPLAHSMKVEPEEDDDVIVLDDEPPVKQELEEVDQQEAPSDPLNTSDSLKLTPVTTLLPPVKNQVKLCQICDTLLPVNEVNITPKGLANLQRCSQLRMDQRFPPNFDLQSIHIHNVCRNKYTLKRMIKEAVKRNRESASVNEFDQADDDSEDQDQEPRAGSASPTALDEAPETSLSELLESEQSMSTPEQSQYQGENKKYSDDFLCRICNCVLKTDVTTVKYKGYLTLQRCSVLRRDNKFLPGTEHELIQVKLHVRCRKTYIKDSAIRMRVKLMERGLPYEEKVFNYIEQCLICEGDASEEFAKQLTRLPSTKRQERVYRIGYQHTGDRMFRASLDFPDSEYGELRKRIKGKDLVALGARYHRSCYLRLSFPRRTAPGTAKGRPAREDIKNNMSLILDYVNEHFEDSQFAIEDLNKVAEMCTATLLSKLNDNYGTVVQHRDDVLIKPIKRILTDKWHDDKLDDEKSERLRIIRTAANIILDDIRSIGFDTRKYPAPASFLDDVHSVVPETLRTFVETVVTKYQKNPESHDSTVTALSHSIMTAARPRTFKSPLLLGIGSLIHQKYASKSLIDLLSSVGFCASYKDVTQFEVSLGQKSLDPEFSKPQFTQFVFDSVESANGPMLVGVQCDTPRTKEKMVARCDKISDYCSGEYKILLEKNYCRPVLDKFIIEDHIDDTAILPTRGDALWLFGKSEPSLTLPGWGAFISKIPKDREHPVSHIRALPVIEAPPSDDAIYTALKEAKEKTKGACVVTLNQPMYQAAQEVVKNSDNGMDNVVLKLGGFDVMKSFLGVIGYIISGSGLKELWCNIYAAEHIEKMMTGHAFARAVRAHFLTRSVLFNIITKDFDLTPEERLEIEGILEGDHVPEGNNQRNYQEPLAITLELLEKRGPTAQLWVQYFRMTVLVAQFLEAERTANWDLHLATLKKMLPYFHAGGYFEYAKSCSLYLQDMKALETKMNAKEYEKFTEKGYFAVRWTENFDWSDRAVEKNMTTLKRPGGITNGTKVTDGFLANWLSAAPTLGLISQLVENFCKPSEGVDPSENKDSRDAAKLQSWFEEHNPFTETANLVSLGTDNVGSDLNCHEAEMVGKQMMRETIGHNYMDVNFERSKCVRPLSVDKSVQIEDLKVPIESDTILKRMSNIRKLKKIPKEKIQSFFEYELAPYPMSLFDDRGMLEANKSDLFDQFLAVDIEDGDNRFHVVDGEFLLHKISWKEGATVSAISYAYVEYVKTRFKNAIVVFGGNKPSDTARLDKVKKSPIVEFQKDTVLTTDKEIFLANEKNKDRFIQYLIIDFTRSGIKIKLHSKDFYSNIIQTAVENAWTYDKAFIVSDNADLLLQMCVHLDKDNVYFMKPSKNPTYFHVDSFRSNKIKPSILFLHAVSGCESTSAIFQQGKSKVCAAITKMHKRDITNLMTIFANPTSDKTAIAEVGIDFIRHLYDDLNKHSNLNSLRYDCFSKSITKSRYDLARMPPSKEAVKQHMYRTYHQIQKWLGNDLPPTEWGWRLNGDHLEPIKTSDKIAHKELLDMISCKCNGICSSSCICKRINLECCVLCLNCNGKSCHGIDMEVDSSETGFRALQKCDAYGNPVNPREVDEEDDDDEEEEPGVSEPAEPRAKRAKREKATNGEEMSQHELEQVYME